MQKIKNFLLNLGGKVIGYVIGFFIFLFVTIVTIFAIFSQVEKSDKNKKIDKIKKFKNDIGTRIQKNKDRHDENQKILDNLPSDDNDIRNKFENDPSGRYN
jgi:hypothetical protein